MGNAASDTVDLENNENDIDDDDDIDPFDGIETLGYRVLGVQPNSPAADAGLVSFLDFLVGANGQYLLGSGENLQDGDEYDDLDLPALLRDNQDKEVELLVWNIKSQDSRLVYITPREGWGGAGLAGVTIRLDNYAGAEDRLIRVLDVSPQSPAMVAGLVAQQDFLLGTTHETLETVDDLADLLHQMVDQVIEFYVYNVDSDVVRVVALMPTLSWGGPGLLGAELGVGYLHRLPHSSRQTQGGSIPRKVRYVADHPNGSNAPPPKQPPPPSGNSKHNNSNNAAGDTEQSHANNRRLLEVEPQLEMEAHESESEEESEVPRKPQFPGPGDAVGRSSTAAAAATPSKQQHHPIVRTCSSSSSAAEAAAAVFSRSPVRTKSGRPIVQPQQHLNNYNNMGNSLLAGGDMPPPPKMHY